MSSQEYMSSSEIHSLVLQASMLRNQIEDLNSIYQFIKSMKQQYTNQIDDIERRLAEEQQRQFADGGVASIHPAVTMRNRTVREYQDMVIDPDDITQIEFIAFDEDEKQAIIGALVESGMESVLYWDEKKLDKLPKKKIPEWVKYTESKERYASVSKKLGEFLINPLAETIRDEEV